MNVVLAATLWAMTVGGPTAGAAPAAGYEHLLNRARKIAAAKAASSLASQVDDRLTTIAVLPLEGDPAGVARRLFTIAATHQGLTVVLRDDLHHILREHEFTSQYRDVFQPETVRRLGRILGADAVVFGSVSELGLLKAQGHVRLTLAAADVMTATVVWGDSVTATSDETWPPKPAPAGGSAVGFLAGRWPVAGGISGALAAATLLMSLWRSRRRARRQTLARNLLAACAPPADPARRLLDHARASLRRAQMTLAERDQVDQAASVLDERVRIERLVRSIETAAGRFDPAILFSAETRPPRADTGLTEVFAEEVVRLAARVEHAVLDRPRDLGAGLAALRQACRRLAAALDGPGPPSPSAG